jgi:asparagine synthase (glutamine-hydrolysing)
MKAMTRVEAATNLTGTKGIRIRTVGYLSRTRDEIAALCEKNRLEDLLHLEGEYIIVIEAENRTVIASSYYGIWQYFYAQVGSDLYHGETVFEVLQKSGLKWKYNFSALADLACLQHVLEDDTLHPDIRRVPPATLLVHSNGTLTRKSLSWSEIHKPGKSTPQEALERFNSSCRRLLGDTNVLSISGGFDSRVILSALIRLGVKPQLLCMGFEDTTDVVISGQIARYVGLPLERVSLELEDYFQSGLEIVKLTGGTKTAENWHTYIYPRKSHYPDGCNFFVGSNGELARSCYTDYGTMARVANLFPSVAVPWWWRAKLRTIVRREQRMFGDAELAGMCEELRNELAPAGCRRRVARLTALCHQTFLEGFDRFFLEQMVRGFISNGLKLYSGRFRWRAPFIDHDWVESVMNLPQRFKFNSNWDRFAIAQNEPGLLDFPFEKDLRNRVHYARYPQWFSDRRTVDFIDAYAHLLEDVLTVKLLRSIVEEHVKLRSRTRTVSFLISQIFWRMAVNPLRSPPAQS